MRHGFISCLHFKDKIQMMPKNSQETAWPAQSSATWNLSLFSLSLFDTWFSTSTKLATKLPMSIKFSIHLFQFKFKHWTRPPEKRHQKSTITVNFTLGQACQCRTFNVADHDESWENHNPCVIFPQTVECTQFSRTILSRKSWCGCRFPFQPSRNHT